RGVRADGERAVDEKTGDAERQMHHCRSEKEPARRHPLVAAPDLQTAWRAFRRGWSTHGIASLIWSPSPEVPALAAQHAARSRGRAARRAQRSRWKSARLAGSARWERTALERGIADVPRGRRRDQDGETRTLRRPERRARPRPWSGGFGNARSAGSRREASAS